MKEYHDVLSSALDALRVSGSVVLDHVYSPPWAVEVPGSAQLLRLFGVKGAARAVAFHIVLRGEVEVRVGRQRVRLGPQGVAACFGGGRHRLGFGQGARVRGLQEFLNSPRARNEAAAPGDTHMVCGAFVLREAGPNPLLAALPGVVQARLLDEELELVGRTLLRELHGGRPGSTFVVHRALETLCVGLVRACAADGALRAPGLLLALRDPRLLRALEAIHEDPSAAWSVDALARCAGLSRSRFAVHFAAVLGESPMQYVTRWRMNQAARLLREAGLSVGEVALRVGYESVPAFTRAFARHLGTTPARYRGVAAA
ncbi:MAG: AraC family transcriptional regulator [Deltaproteobacteria bacterium]|nr:AraC family transcriptional regulator [Deltaproteobacteria bacterium]